MKFKNGKKVQNKYVFRYFHFFIFDLQYVQTGFKNYESRVDNDDGHRWERREATKFGCVDKHNINEESHSSDNVKIRYLEKIRLFPTKHPAPALPNIQFQFHSVHSALWQHHQNKKMNPHFVATDILHSYPHASCLEDDSEMTGRAISKEKT